MKRRCWSKSTMKRTMNKEEYITTYRKLLNPYEADKQSCHGLQSNHTFKRSKKELLATWYHILRTIGLKY